jgi:hypothetical protein
VAVPITARAADPLRLCPIRILLEIKAVTRCRLSFAKGRRVSRLQELLMNAKRGLEPWEPIPKQAWPALAAACGSAEREEIAQRIAALRHDLNAVEEWDGDSRDEIWRAIELFEQVLALSPAAR